MVRSYHSSIAKAFHGDSQEAMICMCSFSPILQCLLHSHISDLCSQANLIDTILGNWDLFGPTSTLDLWPLAFIWRGCDFFWYPSSYQHFRRRNQSPFSQCYTNCKCDLQPHQSLHSSPLTYAFIQDIVALLIIILKCLLQNMPILLVLMALEHPEYGLPYEAVQASLRDPQRFHLMGTILASSPEQSPFESQ